MLRRAALAVAMAFVLSACDGYIEQVTVGSDGTIGFAARATVVCADELQTAIWLGDPCPRIDQASRGNIVNDIPFGFSFDQNRVSLVSTGDRDRREVDVTWEGEISELDTLLISSGALSAVDEFTTTARFERAGTPAAQLADPPDPIAGVAARSRWPAAEFRVIAPGVITEHNGDDIQGRTVIWVLDGDDPGELSVTWSTEERGFRVWWWAVGAAILGIVMMMMVILEGQRTSTHEP